MSLASKVTSALARGSAKMLEAMGVAMEIHNPRTGEEWSVTGHYQALREGVDWEEGGGRLTHTADAWWAREGGPEPETGWMVKVSGRVLRVSEVVDDPLDADWEVRLEGV